MVPILASTLKKEFDEHSFHGYLLDLCKEHYEQIRALSFAFIVYDFQNPAIRKVIQDLHYWQALHDLSGSFLSIFYIDAKDEQQMEPVVLYNMIQFMSTNNLAEMNRILKESFSVSENIELPFVIFFQVEDSNISSSFIVKLKKEIIEDSFIELRDHIKNAVDSIKNVQSEYYGNTTEIYNLIENGVKNGAINKLIKTIILDKIGIGTLVSLAKSVA